MLFKPYHIPMIRSGSKTVTRREWAENYSRPNEGSVQIASDEMFTSDEEAGCYIRILDVYDQPLGEMTDEDARKEGDYENLEEFRDGYEDVYGEGTWDPEKVVAVVEFEYIGQERPGDTEQKQLVTDGGEDYENEDPQGDELPEFEDLEQDDDPLMLECWNCGAETSSGTLGHWVDRSQNLASETCQGCGMEFRTPPLKRRDFDEMLWSPEDYPQTTLPEDEVKRRLPGVGRIVDKEIRNEVIELSQDAPAYFWHVPAASPMSDYHHPFCREYHGLWAHTLMLVEPLCRLAESHVEQGRITEEERDYALAAAFLHDQRKRGPHGTQESSSTSDHDLAMARVIREESDLPEAVAEAVEAHMGPWYDGPEPGTPLQQLVHDVDMLASTSTVTPTIPAPIPEELEELGLEESDSA